MQRIGVFICWCGSNIAATVDVEKVAEVIKGEPGVVFSTNYQYMCSENGQQLIKQAIKEHNLKREISEMTHLDIMPTLIEMIAPKDYKYKTWGISVFNEKRHIPSMNPRSIVINGKIIPINSSDCPNEYKQLHRMYTALAYYRSITNGIFK